MAWALGKVVDPVLSNADVLNIKFMQCTAGGLPTGNVAAVMVGVFPATHRLILVLPVTFLVSTVVFLPLALSISLIMQYVSPGLVGILMLFEVLVAALSS